MKKIILASAAAIAIAGTACAQPAPNAPTRDITRAAAIADAEQRFRALDTNGNGSLEADELQKASEQRRAERRQRMEARLSQMSPEERERFEERRAERGGGEAGGRRGGREGGPGAREGGPFGSSPTTLAEARAQAEQRFDRLDLDRNGVITVAEQEQLRAKRPGRTD